MIHLENNDNRKMKKQRKRIRLSNVIPDIRKQYKNIRQEDILFAAMVFYPVALVDVEAEERSVEDFDAVQLTILKFFATGLSGEDIAALTGLTPEYVAQIKNMLVNVYGHIAADGTITPLGIESIQREKNVQIKYSKRNIYVDAITLAVIPYKQHLDETIFYEKPDAHEFNVGVMAYPDGITEEALEARLRGEGVLDDEEDTTYDKIIGARDIHVNISSIRKLKCLKLRYAIACMLMLDGCKAPIVFGRRFSRHAWIPFGVESEVVRQRYGFEATVKDLGAGRGYLSAMRMRFDDAWEVTLKKKYKDISKKQSAKWESLSEDEKRKLNVQCTWDAIRFFCPFQKGHYRWQDGELFIDGEAFASAQQGYAIAKILSAFAEDGFFRFATEDLCGRLVTIRPEEDDELLKDVARLLKEAIEYGGARKVDRYLRENFNEEPEVKELQPEDEKVELNAEELQLEEETVEPGVTGLQLEEEQAGLEEKEITLEAEKPQSEGEMTELETEEEKSEDEKNVLEETQSEDIIAELTEGQSEEDVISLEAKKSQLETDTTELEEEKKIWENRKKKPPVLEEMRQVLCYFLEEKKDGDEDDG